MPIFTLPSPIAHTPPPFFAPPPPTAPHNPMAGRAPPPPVNRNVHRPNSHPHLPPPPPPRSATTSITPQQLILSLPQHPDFATFRSGTYIVQVPKDQIYRVPPPENSSVADRHRDRNFHKKTLPCCSFFCLGCMAFVVLLIVMLLAIFLTMFAKAQGPNFKVERLAVKETSDKPDYNLILKAQNPNSRVAVAHNAGGGATLHYKKRTVAKGKYPSIYQDSGESKEVDVVLHGTNNGVVWTKDAKSERVRLSLEMDIPAQMRIGTLNGWKLKFHVRCDFTVDKLARGAKVLRQECRTSRT